MLKKLQTGFNAKGYVVEKLKSQAEKYKKEIAMVKNMSNSYYNRNKKDIHVSNIHEAINEIMGFTCKASNGTGEPKQYYIDSAIKYSNNIINNLISLYICLENEKINNKTKGYEKVII